MAALDPILGDPALVSKWEGNAVKGNLLAARPRYVRERWGDEAVEAVADRLGPQARDAFLGSILPFSWYPIPLMVEIDQAIIRGPMGGAPSEMRPFGETVARYDLPTIYKVLFKVGTPAFVIRRINVTYRTYFREGRIESSTPTSTSAIVTFAEGMFPRYVCEHGVTGWLAAALELSGGSNVSVNETACVHDGAARCGWEASWERA